MSLEIALKELMNLGKKLNDELTYEIIHSILSKTEQIVQEREAQGSCRWKPEEVYYDPELVTKVYEVANNCGALNGRRIGSFMMTTEMNKHYSGPVYYIEGSLGDPSIIQRNLPTEIENNAFVAEYKPYVLQ